MSGARIVKALERLGFVKVGGKGSHVKLRRGPNVVIVPLHPEVAPGTFRSIVEQAGLTIDELRDSL